MQYINTLLIKVNLKCFLSWKELANAASLFRNFNQYQKVKH